MTTTETDELLSLEEAADMLCVSKSTLYRMIERKEIKGSKVGRQWRFSQADLQAYLDRGPQAVVVSTVGREEVDALLPSLAEVSQRWGLALPKLDPAALPEDTLTAYITHLVQLATVNRASDIHVVPQRQDVVVQIRVDGVLQELCRIPSAAYPAVIGQLKQMADMNIDERSLPQDGRMHFTFDDQEFDVRVAVLSTIFGESAVMRLLDQRAVLLGLERLHFAEDDLQRLHRWIASPNGLVLCTGPSGSGKTTTLYSCLLAITRPEINTLTIEDPVEYQLPHTRQCSVNRRLGLTFPVTLRAFLRHDPDVIMVGEIRDLATAEIAVQAALTGHMIFTTLHTNDTASTARRLVEMGVEPFLIGGCLTGIISQRLARRICQNCKKPMTLPAAVETHIRDLAAQGGYTIPADATFYQGAGCAECGGRGYRGRTGLYELLEFTSSVREVFLNGATAEEIRRVAVADGMHTLVADGIRKAVEGITTIDEVLRVTTN